MQASEARSIAPGAAQRLGEMETVSMHGTDRRGWSVASRGAVDCGWHFERRLAGLDVSGERHPLMLQRRAGSAVLPPATQRFRQTRGGASQ
ncbi:hypothetical protein AWB67_04054 [Caballeronia terrestris]|uniref:Uncharacterized protein n=1 Tax=Caballeronia terrestris TaxID=1226301 RepID=A0A158JP56_9BURK|nr:hypothetical protein AWB67_04054 [Caballeronia terrestris]